MKILQKCSKLLKRKNLETLRAFQTAENPKQGGVAAVLESDGVKSEWDAAKPFHSIPGPKPLPIPYIGNMWRFLPFGTYQNMDLVDIHQRLYEEFGPIVRISGLGRREQVVVFEPEHAEKMFRNESIWPIRMGMMSLKHYRTVTRKDFYEDREGLITSQGKDWHQFRTATNQTMMQTKNVKAYLDPVAAVIDDFLERVRSIRKPNDEMPEDFLGELNKLSLESFGVVTLDTRLGCLANDLKPDSEAMQMIEKVKQVLELMHYLEFTPSFWMFFPTPTWKKFVKLSDDILEITVKHTTAKWEEIKKQEGSEDKSNKSVLESLLLKTKDPKIPIVMATDLLFAGIDTTSNTVGTILYHLAMNPEKQEKLYQNLKELLPTKTSKITNDVFNELKYTRAVIKESMRISPTTLGNTRVAVKDMIFGEYQIPKDTMVLASNTIMCRLEKYYKDPQKFLPERWLKSLANSEISSKNTNPFVFLPFGFGQRSCIGRRFAELNMDLVISKIIRNFKVSYHYEPMTWRTRLISSPNKPLKFQMTDRPE